MPTKIVFTTISPLPPGVSRQTAIDFLHNHLLILDLNPAITERHAISTPDHALPDEKSCIWYSITEKITYLPGDLMTGAVSFTCAFHNLPHGIQTHCYAPMGVDLREKWTIGGTLPGEPPEPRELGLGAPATGLYIREDVELRCNLLVAGFVKKTMKRAHARLVEIISEEASALEAARQQEKQQHQQHQQHQYQTTARI